eukprot:7970821-Lingulodinium_polyedra.AAC.1
MDHCSKRRIMLIIATAAVGETRGGWRLARTHTPVGMRGAHSKRTAQPTPRETCFAPRARARASRRASHPHARTGAPAASKHKRPNPIASQR